MKQGRKTSGGRYIKPRKKKLTGRQGQSRVVKLEDKRTKLLKMRGGSKKLVSLTNNTVNVIFKGKGKNVKIKNVLETPSNTFLARQNILLKGTIIETELGKAKITNRPSQEGNVQAILID